MAANHDTKLAFIRALQNTRSKGDVLEFELLMQKKDADAKEVREHNEKLTKQIRKLMSGAKKSWTSKAATFEDDIKAMNNKLQTSIRDIEKKIATAQGIVRAIGFIDEAVKFATKVAKAMA